MARIVRLAVALGVISVVMGAQDDPLAWFPLHVGSRWAYEHEWKSGDPRRPNVERWTTEETITKWVTIPEGLVVLREVKLQRKTPEQPTTRRALGLDGQVREEQPGSDGGYLVTREREPYLVRGSCVYIIDNGFDGQTRQLRPPYRKYLAEGLLSPDFCFPLEVGRKWGNTDIPWQVEPTSSEPHSFSPVKYVGAMHIVSEHFGSGGWMDIWFQKDVGVVCEHYVHSGSYDEYTKNLFSFLP